MRPWPNPTQVFIPSAANFASSIEWVELNWTPSVSAGVITYKAYRSLVTGGPYTLIGTTAAPNTQYRDYTVNRSTTYFYVVTAFDGTNESVNSNEASVTTNP